MPANLPRSPLPSGFPGASQVAGLRLRAVRGVFTSVLRENLLAQFTLAVPHPSLIRLPRPQSQAGHVTTTLATFTMASKLQHACRVIREAAPAPSDPPALKDTTSSQGPPTVPALLPQAS